MVGSRKGWNAALALVMGGLAAGVFACSAPPPQKATLLVCEAGENGCPSEKPKSSKQTSKKKDSDDEDGPSGAPAPAPSSPTDEEQAAPAPDADADPDPDPPPPPDPAPGPICTKLKGCCDQLKAAGYSDATCLEIVGTKSENACSLQHKSYKDFGDCT